MIRKAFLLNIHLSPNLKNATPAVVLALTEIKAAGGGELHLEKGEYHFYKEGAEVGFFAVSNNSACDKRMAFPIIGFDGLTVDAHGSTLVFHDVLFPFMVSDSNNIILKNMLIDTGKSPLVEFFIHGASDEGFYMDIDAENDPFTVEDGSLLFKRESETVSGSRPSALAAVAAAYATAIGSVQPIAGKSSRSKTDT